MPNFSQAQLSQQVIGFAGSQAYFQHYSFELQGMLVRLFLSIV
jgi:hypothetical protein